MIGTVCEAGPGAPKCGGKHQNRQEKEDAGDLKPQDAAHSAERAQKTSHAARNAPGNLSGSLTGGSVLSCGFGNLSRCGRPGRGLGACSNLLAGDAPGDPQPNPQSAADGVRFHSIYDGSSDPR